MANEVQFYIGTFVLDNTNGVGVSDIQVSIAKSVQSFVLPKFHGSVIPIGKRQNISVRLRGTVVSSDYDALRTAMDNLKNAFDDTSEKKFTTDDDRQLFVQYKTFSYSYRTIRTFVDFSVEIIASDPFFYSQTLNADTRTPTTTVGYTITNAGNATCRVKVTITAPGGAAVTSDCRLANTTTGEALQYNGTIAASKDLVVNNRVDTPDYVVTNDGTSDFANFAGDFITLQPGANTIVWTSAVASVQVKLEWRDAYK